MSEANVINPATSEYVSSFGTDPSKVLQRDWNDEEYVHRERIYHSEGGFTFKFEVRKWPKSLDIETLKNAMRQDGILD